MLSLIAVPFAILKSHLILLIINYCYGNWSIVVLRRVLYSWFRRYKYEIYEGVFVNGILSQSLSVDYAVPQGSILGPLLFLLYIIDNHSVVERCEIFLFANGTSVASQAISIDVLQRDLKAIQKWLMKNNLNFNAQKSVFDFNKKSASGYCI